MGNKGSLETRESFLSTSFSSLASSWVGNLAPPINRTNGDVPQRKFHSVLMRVESELIEDLCTPKISTSKRLIYKTLSQRNVFQRPSGTISEPDTFDVLRQSQWVGFLMNRVSAVLSQYITKCLERWNLSTDADIDKKYVYLDWRVFIQNQQKYRPNDKSLQYSESEFTKHNHLYGLWMIVIVVWAFP